MRHRYKGRKLGRTHSHRKAMTRNMAVSVIEHERIVTTIQKAKHVKPVVEKLVTLSKVDSTHNRRRAFAHLRDIEAVNKLFTVLGPRFSERPGGYCRILKLAKPRLGDNGQRALLEFVERSAESAEVEEEVEAEVAAE
jgi:large subunit ribosomal protein L17